MSHESIAPVLVVGAGPAGLTIALSLLKNGVPVRIINKAPVDHKEQRGLGQQPRTQEVFHFLGALLEMRTMGIDLQPLVFYKFPGGKEVLTTLRLVASEDPTPSRPFNNPIQVPQYHTEAVLRSHLAKYGCSVELNTEFVGLKQFDDHVEATVKRMEGGEEMIETKSYRWLVGADGGRSVVRKQSGLAFEGTSTPEKAILGELYLEGLDTEHWHMWLKDAGNDLPTSLLVRTTEVPGKFWFMLSGDIDPDQALVSNESVKQALQLAMERDDLPLGEIVHVTDYRPSVRMVNKFRTGRVFVVGDAAHVHTPRGGQGLNSSVQDAFNLGWKLALVETGLAPPSLLDTYNEERLPVIKRMLQETVRMTQDVFTKRGDAESIKSAWQRGTHLKQFGINYRWSSIVFDERFQAIDAQGAEAAALNPYGTEGDSILRAGDRAPNATGLVRVGQDAQSQTTDLFSVFGPTHHTALIFGGGAAGIRAIIKSLQVCPPGALFTVIVSPGADSVALNAADGGDAVLHDGDGTAYAGYGMSEYQTYVVIVRPDGVVGATVSGEEGVRKYFGAVFSDIQPA
ncbi:monooxygenase [Rhodofomes roseus]|uniref:Monooxygenase n=1 Tax=Rhodofomes roseus TaxID=34475 RepID=A0ABQ8K9Q0_9APHY|nr:monooxygenase [Rhodofomes roseus]KAH9834093.1 monooxygenase [Rhodofomes roseus]